MFTEKIEVVNNIVQSILQNLANPNHVRSEEKQL